MEARWTIGGILVSLGGSAMMAVGPDEFPDYKAIVFWLGVAVFVAGVLVMFFPLARRVHKAGSNMAKLVTVKVGPGGADGLEVTGNKSYGFQDVTWLESDGQIKDSRVSDNEAHACSPKKKNIDDTPPKEPK